MQNQSRACIRADGFAAHVIGYVGEVSEQELNTPEFAKYSQGDIVGKDGLERQYNDHADGRGRAAAAWWWTAWAASATVLERSSELTPGNNLQLTLDLDLQAVAELAMEDQRGAVVALDPRNGEVLAMVSRPTFDPNLFTARIRTRIGRS